jgi:hypothetical protein
MLEEREAMSSTALIGGLACKLFLRYLVLKLIPVLAVYVFSVVGGRVYTGMHSLGGLPSLRSEMMTDEQWISPADLFWA